LGQERCRKQKKLVVICVLAPRPVARLQQLLYPALQLSQLPLALLGFLRSPATICRKAAAPFVNCLGSISTGPGFPERHTPITLGKSAVSQAINRLCSRSG